MFLPPKDDPRRQVEMAVRSVLGLALFTGTIGVLVCVLWVRDIKHADRPLIATTALCLAAGASLSAVSFQLNRRKAGAIPAGIILVTLTWLLGIVGILVFSFNRVLLLNGGLITFFAIQSIYHLLRSRGVIQFLSADERRFEPMMTGTSAAAKNTPEVSR